MNKGYRNRKEEYMILKTHYIAEKLNLTVNQVESVLHLLEEGNTLAYIARYRKEQTAGVDENEIRQIQTNSEVYDALESRRDYIYTKISKKGELKKGDLRKLQECTTLKEMEYLYAPYKEKSSSKVSEAVAKGYAPIFKKIKKDITKLTYKNLLKKISNPSEISKENSELVETTHLTYIKELWKDDICSNPEIRKFVQNYYEENIRIRSTVLREELDKEKKYEKYYQHEELLRKISTSRLFALLRGESEGILKLTYVLDKEKLYPLLAHELSLDLETLQDENIREFVEMVIKESYTTRLRASASRLAKGSKRKESELQSIEIFAKNVRQKLLAAPYRNQIILALDPGYAHGCKIAVVNVASQVVLTDVLYLFDGRKLSKALERLHHILDTENVTHMVLGNGTASDRTLSILKDVLEERTAQCKSIPTYEVIDESGASVYSASTIGYEEFPNLSVERRSAINLARRVQDPLAELVKVPPASLGIGEYQHMVNEADLSERLAFEVSSIVNTVGVDVNTASIYLLEHVSGITPTIAKNIIQYREQHGRFTNRKELMKVKGVGERIYEQAIGFLRIYSGSTMLDSTGIHPKDYQRLESLLDSISVDISNLSDEEKIMIKGNHHYFIEKYELRHGKLIEACADYYLLEELGYSLFDIRSEREIPKYQHINLEDLTIGDKVRGTIRNLTTFAAFVDIGLKTSGFLHVSEIKEGYVSSIFDELSIGEVRDFYIKNLDKENMKIGLTLKEIMN